jgi:hypothetical protein
MANSELTGIERQLVLEYLMDGNVPVTVTLIDKKESSVSAENTAPESESTDSTVPASSAGVFPVALRAEQMTVLDQGIILLKNAPGSIKQFAGREVRVQFYFNKLGLYFVSQMKQVSSGLALVIPAKIERVADEPQERPKSFSIILYYEAGKKNGNLHIDCAPADGYRLFENPRWSDVEEDDQKTAKSYLEAIVTSSREEKKNIGNGVHLIPVVRYLSHKENKQSAIEGRAVPPSVLYIDYERIVFGSLKDNMILTEGCEYALKIGFPIESGPVKERAVYVTCSVDRLYTSKDSLRICAVCRYTSIKEEDVRFLYEKVKKEVFEIK